MKVEICIVFPDPEKKRALRAYTVSTNLSVTPCSTGVTICLPFRIQDDKHILKRESGGLYIRVADIIYYPFPSPTKSPNVEVKIILDARSGPLISDEVRKVVSPENELSLGNWEESEFDYDPDWGRGRHR